MLTADMTLVITSTPGVAWALSVALGAGAERDGYYEAGGYWVVAAGHLVELAKPDAYDRRFRTWRLEDLPIIPAEWKTSARTPKSRKTLAWLKRLCRRAHTLVNGFEPGPDGEWAFRLLFRHLNLHQPVQRLWLRNLSREAVLEGFAALEPAGAFDMLFASASARAAADWLVASNATRAFDTRFRHKDDPEPLYVSRLLLPCLTHVVTRERDLSAFRPEESYAILATVTTGADTFTAQWEGGRGLPSRRDAEDIATRIKAAVFGITSKCCVTEVEMQPPPLWNLTRLQIAANHRFGLSASQTLRAALDLFEAGLISWPVTRSTTIPPELVSAVPHLNRRLLEQQAYNFLQGAEPRIPARHSLVASTAPHEHHAIIPTGEPPGDPGHVQGKIYDLVVRRFLANTLPPAVDLHIHVELDAAGHTLRAHSKAEKCCGWRLAEPAPPPTPGEDRFGTVPVMQVSELASLDEVTVQLRRDAPPTRYTDGSLLESLRRVRAGAEGVPGPEDPVEDSYLAAAVSRAGIIDSLVVRGYVVREGNNRLTPTARGITLTALCERIGVQQLMSAEQSAAFEHRLDSIAAGLELPSLLETEIRQVVMDLVACVQRNCTADPQGGAWPPCPICGSELLMEPHVLRCSRSGCTLRVPKLILQRGLSPTELVDLLNTGRTGVLEGFVSNRTGKDFSAALVLQPDGGGVGFAFPERRMGQRTRKTGHAARPAASNRSDSEP